MEESSVDRLSRKKLPLDGDKFSIAPLSLLLVEDHEANRILAKMVLARGQHTIIEANNGLGALEMLVKHDIDTILMDVQMPVMDGLTATRIIRQAEKGEPLKEVGEGLAGQLSQRLQGGHVPILAMTASAMTEDRERYLQAGMDDYLSKPFKIDEVGLALQKISSSPEVPKKS
ncbi:MAG: response regulator [Candidatus Electrothrix sp. ATG1]|nr:response regulator [Candidatus Electrothrix sp. ATG1]